MHEVRCQLRRGGHFLHQALLCTPHFHLPSICRQASVGSPSCSSEERCGVGVSAVDVGAGSLGRDSPPGGGMRGGTASPSTTPGVAV